MKIKPASLSEMEKTTGAKVALTPEEEKKAAKKEARKEAKKAERKAAKEKE